MEPVSSQWCLVTGQDAMDKLKDRKLHLNARENIFTVRMVKHSNRLPREVGESSSLEIFGTQLDKVLNKLL